MSLDWDNIKYLFQIPVDWFKGISERVFNAYGTNFIKVREGDEGGMQIDVDEDMFAQMVRANVDLSGVVYSVNGVRPNISGNVALSAVMTINGEQPDENGNIDLSAVQSVNYVYPDANGNVSVDVGVLTINNTAPDADGNININVNLSSCLLKSDWMNVNSNYSVSPYVYSNTAYTGNLPAAVTNLYSWVGALTYNSLDDAIYDLGYLTEDDLGDLAFLDAVTVDGHTSDENGEVSFGLTADKYLKSDAYGHITTTNDQPIAIDTSQYTPVNVSNQKVITEVTWNGSVLKYSSQNWTFVNGVLVQKTNNSDTTVDTPTVVTWK